MVAEQRCWNDGIGARCTEHPMEDVLGDIYIRFRMNLSLREFIKEGRWTGSMIIGMVCAI